MERTDSGSNTTPIVCPLCEERIFLIGLRDSDAVDVILRRRKDSPVARLYYLAEGQDEARPLHDCGPDQWTPTDGLPDIYPMDPRPILPEAGQGSGFRITMMASYLTGWAKRDDLAATPEDVLLSIDELLDRALTLTGPGETDETTHSAGS